MRPTLPRWILYTIGALVAGLMLGQWWLVTASHALSTSDRLVALGRLAGLVATFGVLLQVILQSRLHSLERSLGMFRLLNIHRLNGYVIFFALLLHPTFLVLGYQINGQPAFLTQLFDFIFNYSDVLKAALASLIIYGVVALSIAIVRLRLPYEVWYIAHLSVYIAILFSFGHQLHNGGDFVGHPWFVAYWYVLYLGTFAVVAWFRFMRPVLIMLQQRFSVQRVVEEASGIHSIYVSARNAKKLGVLPGQFYSWRFLSPQLWWQSHPFSVSAVPQTGSLRLTVKTVGDYTGELPKVKPGTPVFLDGPHGNFTLDLARQPKLLFIAGGIGVTPLRTMIEAMDERFDADLIYACHDKSELAFEPEFKALATSKSLRNHFVYEEESGRLTPDVIKQLVPDIAEREVFLCGPPPMMAAVTQMLVSLGVAREHVYTERFALAASPKD